MMMMMMMMMTCFSTLMQFCKVIASSLDNLQFQLTDLGTLCE